MEGFVGIGSFIHGDKDNRIEICVLQLDTVRPNGDPEIKLKKLPSFVDFVWYLHL